MTMLQLAQYINEFTGNKAGIVHRPLPADDPSQRRPNIDRARAWLNWEPRVGFAEGVQQTVDYFRAFLEGTIG
jgi:nucleoside-diphosphate-sugar epimerase